MAQCANCGYLTAYGIPKSRFPEVDEFERKRGIVFPNCFINQFDLTEEYAWEARLTELPDVYIPNEIDEYDSQSYQIAAGKRVMTKERDCRMFTEYQQGFDPKWHKTEDDRWLDRFREDEANQRQAKYMKYALIITALVVLATLLAPLLPGWIQ